MLQEVLLCVIFPSGGAVSGEASLCTKKTKSLPSSDSGSQEAGRATAGEGCAQLQRHREGDR